MNEQIRAEFESDRQPPEGVYWNSFSECYDSLPCFAEECREYQQRFEGYCDAHARYAGESEQRKNRETGRQELFNLLSQEHGIHCLDTELSDIESCVLSYIHPVGYAGSGEAVLLEDSAHPNAGLIHVGFTNPYQIDYAKESEGAFYPDTENDCWIPLFMLRAHKHRLEWSGVCEDCPPADYPTDETRCAPCPRRSPAPAVPEGHVKMPESADEAQLMANLGIAYLQLYYPERLKPPAVPEVTPEMQAAGMTAWDKAHKEGIRGWPEMLERVFLAMLTQATKEAE